MEAIRRDDIPVADVACSQAFGDGSLRKTKTAPSSRPEHHSLNGQLVRLRNIISERLPTVPHLLGSPVGTESCTRGQEHPNLKAPV